MIQRYVVEFPAIRNPDASIFSSSTSAPTSELASAWGRWRITETARRTMFFANILNFYIHHNHDTQQQSAYYQALNDDLILNMPLPCSDAIWVAGDELSWTSSMQTHNTFSTLHSAMEISNSEIGHEGVTLKSLFSSYSKAEIKQQFARPVGFDSSEGLRNLIVLCACQQFE